MSVGASRHEILSWQVRAS